METLLKKDRSRKAFPPRKIRLRPVSIIQTGLSLENISRPGNMLKTGL